MLDSGSDQVDSAKISVVVRSYNEPPELFKECVDSILRQEAVTFELIVVDSSTNSEIKDICQNHETIGYHYIPSTGLSDGRNKGIEVSKYDYVAFTDPDCVVEQLWLKNLCETLNLKAAIVGGKVIPRWLSKPPSVIRNSKLAWATLSLIDIGDSVVEVAKIVGANFAIDKKVLAQVGYFSENLGRRKGTLLGGEETDLCRRAREQGLKVVYTPFAVVEHQIPPSRLTFGWMFKRMYYGGVARALRGGMPEPVAAKRNSYDYIFLAAFIVPYLAGLARGRLSQALTRAERTE